MSSMHQAHQIGPATSDLAAWRVCVYVCVCVRVCFCMRMQPEYKAGACMYEYNNPSRGLKALQMGSHEAN